MAEKLPEKKARVEPAKEVLDPKMGAKERSNLGERIADSVSSISLSDFAEFTGLSLIKDLGISDYLTDSFNKMRVQAMIEQGGGMLSGPVRGMGAEYISVLADLLKVADGEAVLKLVKTIQYYAVERSKGTKDEDIVRSYVLDIGRLKKFVEIAKSMKGNLVFLGGRYFSQLPPGIKSEENLKFLGFDEALEIIRKNGEQGEEIVKFIEAQLDKPNFLYAKKFILAHLQGFNKIRGFLEEGRYSDLNLDLLRDGDHFEVLQKLLTNKLFVLTKAIDRDYLKKYGGKLLEMSDIGTAAEFVLTPPTKAEMKKNGDEMINIFREAGILPVHSYSSAENREGMLTKLTSIDRKIFEVFGWAAWSLFELDDKDQKRALELMKLPENKKLMGDFYKLFGAIRDQRMQYHKSIKDPNPERAKYIVQKGVSGFFRGILMEGGVGKPSYLDVGVQRAEVEKFLKNYEKYPRIVAALAGKMVENTHAFLIDDVLTVNRVVVQMESLKFSEQDLVMVTDILEWIPVIGPTEYRSKGVDNRYASDIVRDLMDSKDKIALIHKNRDFLRDYLADINFNSGNLLVDLLEKFPLELVVLHKAKFEELARKYPTKAILKGILLNKIKVSDDLDFYIGDSEQVSKFYEKNKIENVRGRFGAEKNNFYDLADLVENSPSRLFFQAHIDALEKFMARASGGDVKRMFSILRENEEFVLKYGNFLFRVLSLLPEVSIDDLGKIVSGLKGLENTLASNEDKILFIVGNLAGGDKDYGEQVLSIVLAMRVEYRDAQKNLDEIWPEVEEFIGKFTARDGTKTFNSKFLRDIVDANRGPGAIYWMDDLLERTVDLYVAAFSADSLENGKVVIDSLKRCLRWRSPNVSNIFTGIEDFFEEEGQGPDASDKVAYENYKRRAGNLLNYVSVIANRPPTLYQEMNEYSKYITLHDLAVIDYLKRGTTGAGDEVVNRYLKEAKELYTDDEATKDHQNKYLFTDYSDGADLRDFDYKRLSAYKNLFESLRIGGLTDLEQVFLRSMKLGRIEKDMEGRDFFEVEKIMNLFSNDVDPNLGNILFKRIFFKKQAGWLAKYFEGFLVENSNGKKKIDVTQNNLPQINAMLRVLSKYLGWCEQEAYPGVAANQIIANIKAVFPDFVPTGKPGSDLRWFLEKFDVEEINFGKLDSFAEFTEFQQFYNAMSENGMEGSAKYLENKLVDIDFNKMSFEGEGYSVFDIRGIEKLRLMVNSRSRVVGDMLVNLIGSKFLEQNCCSVKNLGKLLKFARAWESPGIEHDVDGLYQMYSIYAYVEIASFIKERIESDKSGDGRDNLERDLERMGVEDFDELVSDLEEKGYLVLTEGNVKKALTNLGSGMIRYTFRKGAQKLWGGESVEFDGRSISAKESDWPVRDGVKVYSIAPDGGEEIATLIKCDPTKMKLKVLAEADGMVDMEAEANRLGRRLVFSAPLTFTTGARKMTELAFRDGIQMNYLLSPYSKDGFLLANEEGEQKVLNKTRLKIGDLLKAEDFKNPEIKDVVIRWMNGNKMKFDENNLAAVLDMSINPVQRFLDKNTFFSLIRLKRYSLLGGMLLIDKEAGKEDGTVVKLDDGGDSRRLFLEFADGQFGVIDSTENMTTGKMVELALAMGATKAMYMDTGMYDMATYRDGKGADHIMGHPDTSESTNRVVIYEK